MEKETASTSPTRIAELEQDGELPPEAVDLEQNAMGDSLTRVASGPPYSIFSPKTKRFIVASVSISALISPFGATTFYPALNVLAAQLNVTPAMINLSLTTYMIAQGISPAFIAGMSDQSGRRLSFLICFVIYIVANIGLALQTNYAALLVLRIVQASGCSAAIALCNAVVADIATSAERGRYMGYATSGLLFGPAFGPTIGGLLAQYLGWRSIFWFLAIFSGILLALFALFFPETCRNVVGNGSIPARGINQSILGYLQQRRHANDADSTMDNASVAPKAKRKRTMPNPLTTLRILKEKESAIVLFYNGVFFCSMMMVTGSLPNLFKENYNLDELKVGLCFIAMGAGSLTAALTMGHVVDWNFRRHARRIGMVISKKQQDLRDFPIEVVRMQVVLPGHCIGTAALIAFGWTIKYRLHIAAPEVFLFFIGFGISTAFNQTNTLIIDMHRDKPATATCAINLIRCLMSAGGVAAIIPMIDAMNPGWAFTFIGLVYVLLISVIFLIMKHGQRWRKERLERRERQAARKEEMANAARMADAEVRSMDDKSSHHEKEGDMKTVT